MPLGEHFVPLGKAAIVRPGTDLTIATCGLMVRICLEAAAELESKGVSCEVIDLRSIVPLDVETVAASLHKTGRLLVVDKAWSMFGVGGELAAAMMEHAFDDLDAPVARLHTERVPFPFSPSLDSAVGVTTAKIVAAVDALLAGRAIPPKHPKAESRSDNKFESTCAAAATLNGTAKPQKQPVKAASAAIPGGVPIVMPNMDLTIEEAKILGWSKAVGQSVRAGETILQVETDKAVVDVEALPAACWRKSSPTKERWLRSENQWE